MRREILRPRPNWVEITFLSPEATHGSLLKVDLISRARLHVERVEIVE